LSPLGLLFGLASATSWGFADFGGGLSSRRANVIVATVVVQAVGLVLALAGALLAREIVPGPEAWAWAVAAGTAGFIGIVAFYQALAAGVMGLVAPLAAIIGVGMPVVVSLAAGEPASPTDAVGMVLALVAVVLVSRPAEDAGLGRHGLALALVAGLGFGGFFVCISQSTVAGGETWWPLVAAKGVSAGLAVLVALSTRRGRRYLRSVSPLMVASGVADLGGNLFFLLSRAQGTLGIASVVASQYPAITVILAAVVLRERLARIHVVGILTAMLGIVLIALP
jgi:drug/metabolite transporter (DMT)-like permease